MNASSIFLVAFFTSIFTSVGTVYLVERLHLIPEQQAAVVHSTVPSLEGLSENDARQNLSAVGLSLLIGGRESHPKAATGTVIRQSLAAGQKLPRGEAVSVTLAEALPKVPSVLGRSVEEATRLLEEKGFKVRLGEAIADDKIAEGQIVAQVPEADTALEKDQAVLVHASSGSGAVEVPNVVGLSFVNAQKKLEAAGFKLKARWVTLAETQTYVALQQEPKGGSKLKKGADVIVTANRD